MGQRKSLRDGRGAPAGGAAGGLAVVRGGDAHAVPYVSRETSGKTRDRDDEAATAELERAPAREPRREPERFVTTSGPDPGLVAPRALPADENPAVVYILSLSEGSRRTMRTSLEKIAFVISGGRADAKGVAWWKLRYQHAAAIRSELSERYAPATANKMLSALKGVLKASFRLGYMSADDYGRARDVPPVRGSRLPPGRSFDRG